MTATTAAIKALALTAAAFSAAPCAFAQADAADSARSLERPVMSVFTAEAGHASQLDTYVSPVTYRGTAVRLGYERMQAMRFSPLKWVMQVEAGVEYDLTHNPAGNHTSHALAADAKWAMLRRIGRTPLPGLQFQAGFMTQLRGGVIYNPINANNVVAAKIHWSVGATALAAYTVNRGGRVPVTLRYQTTMPVAGVFFSPEYDESYYEIYVGNRKGLANFGWWGNRFDLTNLLTADIHLGGTVLRVGYRGRIETSWIKHINTHIFTHSVVLGIGGEWLSLSRGKASRQRVASAIY